MKIRRLEERDIPQAVVLGKYVAAHSAFSVCAWNDEVFEAALRELINHPDGLPMIVCDGETIIGYALASLGTNYFGDEIILSVASWFVKEEYRGSHVGVALLTFLDTIAQSRGIKEIKMEGPAEIESFMESQGYHVTGYNFMKRK